MWIAPSIGSQRRRERRKEEGEGERERRKEKGKKERKRERERIKEKGKKELWFITIRSYGFPSIFENGFIIFQIVFNIKSETINTCPPLSPPKNNPAPTALFQAMTDDI